MLPGYVFVSCGGTVAEYYRLVAIPNAIRLLPGKGEYTPVPENQMAWILALSNGGKPWGISTAVNLPADKVSSANADGPLKVVAGPLIGRERMILNWDRRRRRAKIRVDVLNRTRLIDVGLMEQTQT